VVEFAERLLIGVARNNKKSVAYGSQKTAKQPPAAILCAPPWLAIAKVSAMSLVTLSRRGRRSNFRLAGARALPSFETVLVYTSVAAAFATVTCILLGLLG
jgi:hypothetical protein